MAIKKDYLIEKRNVLNELRSNNMKLQEIRFFCIYLSKINARDVSTRVVRFPIDEFQRIMELGRAKIDYIVGVTNSLLCKIVNIPENEGIKSFQLFKRCRINKDESGEWFVEIDAHDDALPLMFDFKDKYFTYELWNALRLKSSNQIRMYELLKQYEKTGKRTISLDDLKELMGMEKSDYLRRYNSFKADVLDICQEALEACTDIKFEYETIKKGRGGKVSAIKFIISKNENYENPLSLEDFIDVDNAKTEAVLDDTIAIEFVSERLEFLSDACGGEFSESEMQVLYNLIIQIIPRPVGDSSQNYQIRIYDHLKHRYDMLNMQAERKEIKNRFGYFKKMLESDIETN